MYREPTVSDIARAVSTCVIDNDQSMAIRLMFRIVERYDKCDLVTRAEMIRECPPVSYTHLTLPTIYSV